MDRCFLIEYDTNKRNIIQDAITKGRVAINTFGEKVCKSIQPILRGMLTGCEQENERITKLHLKELRLEKSMCYKFKNKSLIILRRAHKKKEYFVKNVNHKTTKKKPETKKMINFLSKKDFLNRNKLWIINYNLMKEKFKAKKEINNYKLEKAEDDLKKNLKKEKKYKLIKLIKQKRKDPIRRAQIDQLIRKYRRNKSNFHKHKKIFDKKLKLIETHSAVILSRDWCPSDKIYAINTGLFSIIDRRGSPCTLR